MNLKESYRYANYLDNLYETAQKHLYDKAFTTTTKQNHLRQKANSDATDEIIEVPKSYDVDYTPNDVIDFIIKVIAEKESLADAIATAKAGTEINIDNAISMNKKRQAFIGALKSIANIKSGEKTVTGSGYKFNAEGNQVKYFYDIIEITQIDFDLNDVKALIKKYSKICDDVSAKLDSIEINTELDFIPRWDVSDTFEDVLATK